MKSILMIRMRVPICQFRLVARGWNEPTRRYGTDATLFEIEVRRFGLRLRYRWEAQSDQQR